ncbi:hypothetical protein Scep_025372 [Stephania cephalantha]|uniref:3'-5' exonuclease domain-containing protein n=1 Tax=Stephania cephalantha TaxID=152367 RepID=A0AAP0ENQ5_9MAGN
MNSITKPNEIRWVSTTDSAEFTQLSWALTHSSLVALDAEWKPTRSPTHRSSSFPTVSLLQIACRVDSVANSVVPTTEPLRSRVSVFLVDLLAIDLRSLFDLLRETFVSPDVLKLGFRFKQDLVYLSSTFCSQGCDPGFDRVEPFMDITSVYNHLQLKQLGRKPSKQSKSLAAICGEVLGASLSKELQCSDWSLRPLTEDQKIYAASDANCLLEIFDVFQRNFLEEGDSSDSTTKLPSANVIIGLKEIFEKPDDCDHVCRTKFCQASDMVRSASLSEIRERNLTTAGCVSRSISRNTFPLDVSLSKIIRKYGDKLLLKESDRKPRAFKKKTWQTLVGREAAAEDALVNGRGEFAWKPPRDLNVHGDNVKKFLSDVKFIDSYLLEGLGDFLNSVGRRAAASGSRRTDRRALSVAATFEGRDGCHKNVDGIKHEYLLKAQIDFVRQIWKDRSLIELNITCQLTFNKDKLKIKMTQENGKNVSKPLDSNDLISASFDLQIYPNQVLSKTVEFCSTMQCNPMFNFNIDIFILKTQTRVNTS